MNTSKTDGGIGVASILGVVFIILKLTGTINWPWIWVVSPFWIPLGIALLVLLVALLVVQGFSRGR